MRIIVVVVVALHFNLLSAGRQQQLLLRIVIHSHCDPPSDRQAGRHGRKRYIHSYSTCCCCGRPTKVSLHISRLHLFFLLLYLYSVVRHSFLLITLRPLVRLFVRTPFQRLFIIFTSSSSSSSSSFQIKCKRRGKEEAKKIKMRIHHLRRKGP